MSRAIRFDDAVRITDEPVQCEMWREAFDESAGWVDRKDVQMPRDEALIDVCRRYGFPPVAEQELINQRDSWDDPRIRRLGAHVQWLIAERYTPAGHHRLGWPAVFSHCPLFYAYAALGLSQSVAAEQAERGIDPDVTRATLWDIGQQVHLHQRVYREPGMNKGWWLSHHLSHQLFRLGRLQFQRMRLPRPYGPVAAGEPYLDVHVPEDGILDPAACDVSFERAAVFFAHHFPQERPRLLLCTSWLLDPALAGFLPQTSNIVRFQRRFDLHMLRDGPSSVFEFLFDRPDLDRAVEPDLATLPRDSSLRCAVIDHYARGEVIRMGVGSFAL